MAIVGKQIATQTGQWDAVATGSRNQRGLAGAHLGAMPEPSWITRVGVWCRKGGGKGTPRATLALWQEGPTGAPAARLGLTARLAVPTTAGGANLEGGIISTNPAFSPGNGAVLVAAGQRLVIGGAIDTADVDVAVVAGDAFPHYRRTVANGVPTDPFAAADTVSGPVWALYLVRVPNTPPSAPTAPAPASGAALNTTLPTFAGGFSDPDAAPYGDKLRSYKVELRAAGETALRWQAEYTATGAEQTAARFSRLYEGTALATGGAYEWRACVADASGSYGPWTGWLPFTVNATGAVTLAGNPTGRINTNAPSGWDGAWSHPTGVAMDRAQVRVLQSGIVVKLGAEAAVAAASGAGFTVPAASAGIGTLAWGVDYAYQIRGRDGNGLWSPWSDARAFRTNAIPNVPVNLQPPNGSSSTSRPLLEFSSFDADDDVSALTTEVRLKNSAGALLFTRNATYQPAGFLWRYTTTASDLAGYGTYKWDARTGDGLNWSAWSPEQTFFYAAGPTVAYLAPWPGQVFATSTPRVSWQAIAGQTKYRVVVYVNDATRVVYDSGTVTSAASDHEIPAGYLKNGGVYDLVVTLTDATNASGSGLRQLFGVTYPTPGAPTGAVVSPALAPRDDEATALELTWDMSGAAPGQFDHYTVRRYETGSPDTTTVILKRIANIAQTRWTDYHAAANTPYTYSVSQTLRVGADTVESAPAETDGILDLRAIVVAAARDGGQARAVLRFAAKLGADYRDDQQAYPTWGDPAPFIVAGPQQYEVVAGGFNLRDGAVGARSADADLADLVRLWRAQAPVSYRDDRGDRLFGKITDLKRTNRTRGYDVELTITEVSFSEGEP